MGKTVGVSSSSHKQVKMKGALGKHIGRYLDQYTFICVFGSVVGYAVMPLIGTLETLVLSVIVIGLSIHGLRKNSHKEDDRRRTREERRARKSDSKKSLHVQVITDSETQHRRQRDETHKTPKDPDMIAEEEEAERLRRLEEKREKKARKKEERNRRREEERKEKEKEEQARRERQEQRALKKQQEKEAKEKARGFLLPTYETIKAIVTPNRRLRREREPSTSSNSSSSSSTHSHRSHPHTPRRPHPQPFRASSDPLLYPAMKPTPWSPKTTKSQNNLFPQVPGVSNKNTPWLSSPHTPHTITSSTSLTEIWQGQEVALPHYADSTTHNTWSNLTRPSNALPNWSSVPVETLTSWCPEVCPTSNSLADRNIWKDVRHGNEQQNGGLDSLYAQSSRFYSLFNTDHSSPFMNFHSPLPPTSGDVDHVINPERQLDDSSLARTNETGSGSQSRASSYDEWPNI